MNINIVKIIETFSIVVQWDEVDDFLLTSYIVYWNGGRDQVEAVAVANQTSYTITGLTLDTVYTVTVAATNTCGDGPEFRTTVSLFTDTTFTTSTISPTVTASTNHVTTTVNPSRTSNPSTTTITTISAITTVNGNADISSSRNSDTTLTTTVENPGITVATNIAKYNTPTTDETSKFSIYFM